MDQELKFGDECIVLQDVCSTKKPEKKSATNVWIPAKSTVTIVSVSTNMAIVRYGKASFPTRIENLILKPKETTNDSRPA